MFTRKSATFSSRDYDAEAIARIKECSLWSRVEFIFHDGRDVRDVRLRLARIAAMLFWASEDHRNLPNCVRRIEDRGGRIAIHWKPPGPPDEWFGVVAEAWRRAGGEGVPCSYWQ